MATASAAWFGANDGSRKWQRAQAIIDQFPEVATASLHSAVVSGQLDHVRRLLERGPERVHEKGGPERWEPLLFLCYSRPPHDKARDNALTIAEALLDAGADPKRLHDGRTIASPRSAALWVKARHAGPSTHRPASLAFAARARRLVEPEPSAVQRAPAHGCGGVAAVALRVRPRCARSVRLHWHRRESGTRL